MNKRKAERLIEYRFWNFHSKLVEEHPQYRLMFDKIVSDAQDNGLLWEVLELAQYHLDSDIDLKGENNITIDNNLEAIEYSYSQWVK